MTAYVMIIRKTTHAPEHFEPYFRLAPLAPAGKASYVCKNSEVEVLEGEAVEAAVLLSFPTMADARHWHGSPEYQRALAHRLRAADYLTLLIDGQVNLPQN